MYKVIRIVSLEINPVKTSQQITVGSFFIVTTFSIYLTIRGGVHFLGPLIDLVWKCTRIQVHMVMVGVHHRNLSSSIQQRKSCFACDSQFQCSCVAMLHASAIGTLEIDQLFCLLRALIPTQNTWKLQSRSQIFLGSIQVREGCCPSSLEGRWLLRFEPGKTSQSLIGFSKDHPNTAYMDSDCHRGLDCALGY